MRSAAGFALLALAAAPMAVWCQAPVVSALVDAASFAPTGGHPGAIVTIFGTNLAAATATAQAYPLPRRLGGTTVTWSGIQAPLFYVSPTQINLQVPWELQTANEEQINEKIEIMRDSMPANAKALRQAVTIKQPALRMGQHRPKPAHGGRADAHADHASGRFQRLLHAVPAGPRHQPDLPVGQHAVHVEKNNLDALGALCCR